MWERLHEANSIGSWNITFPLAIPTQPKKRAKIWHAVLKCSFRLRKQLDYVQINKDLFFLQLKKYVYETRKP